MGESLRSAMSAMSTPRGYRRGDKEDLLASTVRTDPSATKGLTLENKDTRNELNYPLGASYDSLMLPTFTSAFMTAQGPWQHGEDIRYMGPKKRGGIAKSNGIKALQPSGRLMGSDVQAWWPDPRPSPSEEWVPGQNTLRQTCPFALGDKMDTHDRRTFEPRALQTSKAWNDKVEELQKASKKMSETERLLRQGIRKAVSSVRGELSEMGYDKRSDKGTMSIVSQDTHDAETVISNGSINTTLSHMNETNLHSTNKVLDWMSPPNSWKPQSQVPDFIEVQKGRNMGDNTTKAMRDHSKVLDDQAWRSNPNRRSDPVHRVHGIVSARYYNLRDGQHTMYQKRVPVGKVTKNPAEDEAARKYREKGEKEGLYSPWNTFIDTRKKQSAQQSDERQLIQDATQHMRRLMTPRRGERNFPKQVWNRFSGRQDPDEWVGATVRPGQEEQGVRQLLRSVPAPELYVSKEGAEELPIRPLTDRSGTSAVKWPGASLLRTTTSQSSNRAINNLLRQRGLAMGHPLLSDQNVNIVYKEV